MGWAERGVALDGEGGMAAAGRAAPDDDDFGA